MLDLCPYTVVPVSFVKLLAIGTRHCSFEDPIDWENQNQCLVRCIDCF
uniref:Uncharacterized protein n=1 Tax=Arundo donax TaxID=35708 RepID=A0A0A9HRB1_ARUDO